MIFSVIWDPSALSQLVEIWLNAIDQQAVTFASNKIDRELRVDPDSKGTPSGNYFVIIEDPLAVLYQINLDDRIVKVIAIRRSF